MYRGGPTAPRAPLDVPAREAVLRGDLAEELDGAELDRLARPTAKLMATACVGIGAVLVAFASAWTHNVGGDSAWVPWAFALAGIACVSGVVGALIGDARLLVAALVAIPLLLGAGRHEAWLEEKNPYLLDPRKRTLPVSTTGAACLSIALAVAVAAGLRDARVIRAARRERYRRSFGRTP